MKGDLKHRNVGDTAGVPVELVASHPRVNLWFDADCDGQPNGVVSLWKPVGFLPPIGMTLVPFSDCDEWEWEHDDVAVVDHTWFVDKSLVVARCALTRPDCLEANDVFWNAMASAGWFRETKEHNQWD